jgi:hypothetical protein
VLWIVCRDAAAVFPSIIASFIQRACAVVPIRLCTFIAVLQEMQRKGSTVLVPWSPTVLIRYWDMRWSKYQERLLSSREKRREVQMQRRMQALGLSVHS